MLSRVVPMASRFGGVAARQFSRTAVPAVSQRSGGAGHPSSSDSDYDFFRQLNNPHRTNDSFSNKKGAALGSDLDFESSDTDQLFYGQSNLNDFSKYMYDSEVPVFSATSPTSASTPSFSDIISQVNRMNLSYSNDTMNIPAEDITEAIEVALRAEEEINKTSLYDSRLSAPPSIDPNTYVDGLSPLQFQGLSSDVRKIFSLANASQAEINKFNIRRSMDAMRRSPVDSGSPEAQIAAITTRIDYMTNHIKMHPKDSSCRRRIVQLVHRRQRMLSYLKRSSLERYVQTVHALKLRSA
ncbi:hypothetical protein H696_03343 [Fonticula alba]|uniref:30S ribosomal protein S15 n=1 Tax=Fonticula alba TaxID=691883 RepID=A0A058Z8L8_FONAL|nr:hypothetical protein H696_03343 [Fonticula alba]KCV69872.1 hypothetical protein H696_03343 [Fonticula alba]|eukprot:XP_009495478.1 hypothetical protein H696_03343 [Fonticula alba]